MKRRIEKKLDEGIKKIGVISAVVAVAIIAYSIGYSMASGELYHSGFDDGYTYREYECNQTFLKSMYYAKIEDGQGLQIPIP